MAMSKSYQDDIELLKYQRTDYLEEIEFLFNKATALNIHSDPGEIAEFKVRYTNLDNQYINFKSVQTELAKTYLSIKEVNELNALQKMNQEVKDKYYKIVTFKESLFQNEVAPDLNTKLNNSPHAKLPKINLPSFDGALKEWPNFKDLFSSLVHSNNTLPNIEKFQYLLSCTKGEPNSLVRSLPISSDNYEIIWNQLLDRFDNKRLLATHYIEEIFNLANVNFESPKPLRNLLDTLTENFHALKSLNIPGNLGDFIILQVILKKIDRHTRQLFERKCAETEFPSLDDFINFLKEHCKCLEVSQPHFSKPNFTTKPVDNSKYSKKPNQFNQPFQPKVFLTNTEVSSCLYCSNNHSTYHCPEFLKLTVINRREFIKSKQACFNCLSSSHMLLKCNSIHRCRKCSKRHHTCLHDDSFVPNGSVNPTKPSDSQPKPPAEAKPSNSDQLNTVIGMHTSSQTDVTTLLGTVILEVQDSNHNFQTVRALIDPGSQGSFITETCVQKLNLPRSKFHQPIMGLSQTVVCGAKGLVSCFMKPTNKATPVLHTNAIILNQITSAMPTIKLSPTIKQYFKDLPLADTNFDTPGAIDFLIGADLFPNVFDGGRLNSPQGYPTPFHTIFGWVLIGQTNSSNLSSQTISANLTISDHNSSLDASIKRFWEIEEITPSKSLTLSPEDELCEHSFVSTHSRDQSGRYMVKLPFKEEPPVLGNSMNRAKQCLLSLEKRFEHNQDLKTSYVDFLNQYEDLNHMSLLSTNALPPAYIIPHHGVLKSSDTSKLRVVFNASAKTDSFRSLNDELLTGPKLQNDICQILSRFRLHPYVMSTDICKMYRQILIHPDHRKYQTILWRKNTNLPIEIYSLNTVTYGVSSSPFLALRTLHQLVHDEGSKFPLASHAVLEDMFVDDCITGSDTLENLLTLKFQLISLFKLGGFDLGKWSSNVPQLLKDVPVEKQLVFESDKNENSSIKVLGLKWLPQSDIFTYDSPPKECPSTKRELLSYISKTFDPLGLVTPSVFWAKQLMQQLWTRGLSWDDPLPNDIILQWKTFHDEIPLLSTLQIPRFIYRANIKEAQIHAFCDASEVGFACCIYLRTVDKSNTVTVHLAIAKSRVAPLKRLSIPKLELCGAHLLSKLVKFYKTTLEKTSLSEIPLYAWSDSKVCLSWIRTAPHLLKTFVGNRVVDIQEVITPSQWFYVPSAENPADCASRGIMPSQLKNHPLWWHGPEWLLLLPSQWPNQSDTSCSIEECSSEIKSTTVLATTVTQKDNMILNFIQRFSSFLRLQRCIAYILRFIHKCRKSEPEIKSNFLTTTELNHATNTLLKCTQNHYFFEEIKSIESKKPCSPAIQRLNPFIDKLGIVRVGGRLRHSQQDFDSKHPILVPKQSPLANLIIDHYHTMYLHAGPRLLHSLINQKYWIVSARQKIRQRLAKCITCVKFKAQNIQPFMADLPKTRIVPSQPFTHCGIDYGGPFLTKTDKKRKPQIVKSYICLFVCLATKAIHLELVSSLSTEAFLAAFCRFFSRRGLPTDVYSDQGSNFVGAHRTLDELYNFISQPKNQLEISDKLATKGVHWHFNPPATPHFGGIWEAGIKSTKHHLKHVIGEQKLTFEEFYTLLSSIEAILNSRPLGPLSTDPNEIDTLTPGHFLIGKPLTTIPQPDFTDIPMNRLSRWQLVQQQTQHFWKRWSQEYLHTLQQRQKWTTTNQNLQINDIVLIREPNLPVMSWIMGRVVDTHPGTDGIVRVATLNTKNGIMKRPTIKLCPLPVHEMTNQKT